MGNGNLPSYVASKHGVIGLSKCVCVLYDYICTFLLMTVLRMVKSLRRKEFELTHSALGKLYCLKC